MAASEAKVTLARCDVRKQARGGQSSASMRARALGGLLLLSVPWGPAGHFAPGHSGVAASHGTQQRPV